MRIPRHQEWNLTIQERGFGNCAGQELAVKRPPLGIAEGRGLRRRQPELLMVEEQILAVEREAQVLVVLVAEARDEALEVQRILLHIVVRQEPLEHAESR